VELVNWCVSSGFLSELAQAALLMLGLDPAPGLAGGHEGFLRSSDMMLKALITARGLHLMMYVW
jgi:hypothetical protein